MLEACRIVELPKIESECGNLSVIESRRHVPFEIKRVYWTYDVPGGAERGGHAHKELRQLIIAASGSFEVTLNDGCDKKAYYLNRPNYGLLIAPMIWREIGNFSSGSVCMVLASDVYRETDYYREYKDFLRAVKKRSY
jgi:hypothetical protein